MVRRTGVDIANRPAAPEGIMPTQTLDPTLQEFLRGHHIATLGTHNADGSIHLIAVWYLFESGSLFIATSSKSQKARNVAARPSPIPTSALYLPRWMMSPCDSRPYRGFRGIWPRWTPKPLAAD